MARAQVAVGPVADHHQRDQREARKRAEEHDLDRRVVAAEELHHRVVGGIDAEGEKRHKRAAQVVAGSGHGPASFALPPPGVRCQKSPVGSITPDRPAVTPSEFPPRGTGRTVGTRARPGTRRAAPPGRAHPPATSGASAPLALREPIGGASPQTADRHCVGAHPRAGAALRRARFQGPQRARSHQGRTKTGPPAPRRAGPTGRRDPHRRPMAQDGPAASTARRRRGGGRHGWAVECPRGSPPAPPESRRPCPRWRPARRPPAPSDRRCARRRPAPSRPPLPAASASAPWSKE